MEKVNKQKQLKADYAYCEKIIKQYSHSFYYAFSKLPAEKSSAIYAIYAFCRFADDAVDHESNPTKQKEAIEAMRTDFAQFEAGHTKETPIWRSLRDVFQRFEMQFEPFYLQLEGQMQDIHFEQPQTIDELEDYSRLVAGSVGLMLLPIIASQHADELKEAANSLGIAMQLTNILRDVGEDWRNRQRIYLPADFLMEAGYTPAQLQAQENNTVFQTVWERVAVLAEQRYEQFTQSVHLFDADSRRQVLFSAHVYRGILNTVRNNNYDCFTKRNYVSALEMKNILANLKQQ